MIVLRTLFLSFAALLSLSACKPAPSPSATPANAQLSGGQTSTLRQDQYAYSQPASNLDAQAHLEFSVGNSFFKNPWVTAPASTDARDGLGPLFNSNACKNCHINNGRARPPTTNAATATGLVVRLNHSQSSTINNPSLQPDPIYGAQLQDMAIAEATPEARIRLSYQRHSLRFADGFEVELQKPALHLERLAYGPLHPATETSLRVAPPMIGLGLLEAISAQDILAQADPEDANGDGIRGRANWVWAANTEQPQLGRFGWKAAHPSLDQQNSSAFALDLGLTSTLFSQDDCTPQQNCSTFADGGTPEVSERISQAVLFYTRTLAVPARRHLSDPQVIAGEQLFHQAGCPACHTPSFVTRPDAALKALAKQTIYPYSDLLLHDMGEGLADSLSEYQATGSQWRTPPLWGIGLSETVSGHSHFLHDGRARNLLEAILWHGGEAEQAQQYVLTFNAEQRAALLAFLHSL